MTGAEFRSIIYLARLVKAVKTSHRRPKEYQTGSVAEGEEEGISISDLEYCCISIMHHSLRRSWVFEIDADSGVGLEGQIWHCSITLAWN